MEKGNSKEAQTAKRLGKFKTDEPRDQVINLRLSKSELAMIDELCKNRKLSGVKSASRTDVIVLAVKYSTGELSLLDRMEMNLMEGKSLFDGANYPKGKYQDWLAQK